MTNSTAPNPDHLTLWNSVMCTNPQYTKKYSGKGGFSGTSITAQYKFQQLTEAFGPCGIGWGYKVLSDRFIQGGTMFSPATEKQDAIPMGSEYTHVIHLQFWFYLNGVRGEIESYGTTSHVSKNKYGVETDHESVKKTLTDAIGKAMQMLGFNADIYLGYFDDQSYLNASTRAYADENAMAKMVIVDANGVITAPKALPPIQLDKLSPACRGQIERLRTIVKPEERHRLQTAAEFESRYSGYDQEAYLQALQEQNLFLDQQLAKSNPSALPANVATSDDF